MMVEISHPCCSQELIIQGETVTIYSGCNGRVVWSGDRIAFAQWWVENDPTVMAEGRLIESPAEALEAAVPEGQSVWRAWRGEAD